MNRTEPDYQFDAYLRHQDCDEMLCDVCVWMPIGNHKDMRVEISIPYDPTWKNKPRGGYRLESENFEFVASDVHIKKYSMKNSGRKAGRALIQLLHIGNVTIKEIVPTDNDVVANLYFHLSNLNYASPQEGIVPNYRGQLTIEEEKCYVVSCSEINGSFVIKKYANWMHHSKNEKSVYRFPVLSWESDSEFRVQDVPFIEKLADDVALLLTFASRHRTLVLGCNYDCERKQYQKIRNPLERNKSPVEEIPGNELVPLDIFENFISCALSYWCGFSEIKKNAIRQIIVALHPLTEPFAVQDYIKLFSAFEGIIASMDKSLMEEKLKGNAWKKVESKLRDCINEMEFDNEIKDNLKDKLCELKRETIDRRGKRFLSSLNLTVTDLWSVFDGSFSLLKIRNKLAHGDFNNDKYDVLMAAREHLKVLLERVVICCLGGNVFQTRAGAAQIGNDYYFQKDVISALQLKLNKSNV